jgi:hypothetical protein
MTPSDPVQPPIVQASGKIAGTGKDRMVVHPKHYNQVPGIECMDVVKHFDFCTGSAIKYLWRAGCKDPAKTIEDLEKAIYYIKIRIEKERGRQEDGNAIPVD